MAEQGEGTQSPRLVARETDQAAGTPGRKIQIRTQRERGWTKAKRTAFLDHLAATCNVWRSAEVAGIHAANCYALKRRDPEFAALWAAALEAGYERIETQLLARAIGQNPARDQDFGGSIVPDEADFDPALAMKVLAQRETRQANRPRGPVGKRVPIEQVRAVLLVKLAGLRARLERERAAAAAPVPASACTAAVDEPTA